MIAELREKFNRSFEEKRYNQFLKDVWQETNDEEDFRICETPIFIDRKLEGKLREACSQILYEIGKPEFKEYNSSAIPEGLHVSNEAEHPVFLQIDFGLVEMDGEIKPQLIELQGFPSLYAFQIFVDQKIRDHFAISDDLTTYYGGYDYDSYIKLFRDSVVGDSDPENVVLLEINPHQQKTKIDFYLTNKFIGVKPVCIREIFQRGSKLYYENNGTETPIDKIYNRVIFDELNREKRDLKFDFHSDLDVEWIGHPNWFFKISKHTLPYLHNEYCPHSIFLSDYRNSKIDLKDYVLKPLYSFAGSGVVIDVDESTIKPIKDRQNYILQRKVNYEPILETPDGKAKVEIRMMFLWNDEPVLVNNLLRVSKGKMMGVDFNKNKTWIGASTAYHYK